MMRLTVVGFLAGLVLCEAVQGFDDAALRMVLETIQGSTKFVSEAAGRSLQGLRVSQREMPTRSLRSAPLGRHLLQSQDCVWNNEECTVKSTMISELLRKAVDEKGFISTQFADMYETCGQETNEDKCNTASCVWDSGAGCLPIVQDDEELSMKCAGDLKPLLELSASNEECFAKYKEQEECTSSDNCMWYSDRCGADLWMTFLGIPSQKNGLPKGFGKAVKTRSSRLEELYNYSRTVSGMKADEILSWYPTKSECLTEVDEKVCTFVQNCLDEGFRSGFYCSKKYETPGDACDNDAKCASLEPDCVVKESYVKQIVKEELEKLINQASKAEAWVLIQNLSSCSEATTQGACLDPCTWNESICEAGIYKNLAEEAKKQDDPKCGAVSLLLDTGCIDLKNEGCSADSRCVWDDTQGTCQPTYHELLKALLQKDPSFSFLKKEWKKCKNKKEANCGSQQN